VSERKAVPSPESAVLAGYRRPIIEEGSEGIREFLGVLLRRKAALLLPVLLTPVIALGLAMLQDPVYESSADVLVTSGSVARALTELPGLSSPDQPERNARTQVGLARLPRVAQGVIERAPLFESADDFLARSRVSVEPDTDLLRFTVEDRDAEQASRLATLYAQEFTEYRNSLDLQAIRSTKLTISRTLARLAAAGERGSALFAELRRARRQLEAAEALRGSTAILVQPAISATRIKPRPTRDAILGLGLGILLGVGLAFLIDRLDTRVRSSEVAEAIVGVPVLAELPAPPPLPQGAKTRVSMLDFPYGAYAEAVRKLRANLEFANLDAGARVLMVTSAVAGEGKSTVASDLAVALARSGRAVALCDLDPRAPSLHAMFGLGDRRGLVEAAFGSESLDRALVPVRWGMERPAHEQPPHPPATPAAQSDLDDLIVHPRSGVSTPRGRLSVLPLGRRRPPSPAEFVGSGAVRQLVAELAQRCDIVVLDTPPLLPVSDSLTISEYVDAALLVCGLETSRRPTLRDLRRILATFPARVLGLVVTGIEPGPTYGPYLERAGGDIHPLAGSVGR
jgi:Mrp family chromosome partitioning ATPase/capsular polysaccharide biosynthesis protein